MPGHDLDPRQGAKEGTRWSRRVVHANRSAHMVEGRPVLHPKVSFLSANHGFSTRVSCHTLENSATLNMRIGIYPGFKRPALWFACFRCLVQSDSLRCSSSALLRTEPAQGSLHHWCGQDGLSTSIHQYPVAELRLDFSKTRASAENTRDISSRLQIWKNESPDTWLSFKQQNAELTASSRGERWMPRTPQIWW